MKQFGAVRTHLPTYQRVYSALTAATKACCVLKPDDIYQKNMHPVPLIDRISDTLICRTW